MWLRSPEWPLSLYHPQEQKWPVGNLMDPTGEKINLGTKAA